MPEGANHRIVSGKAFASDAFGHHPGIAQDGRPAERAWRPQVAARAKLLNLQQYRSCRNCELVARLPILNRVASLTNLLRLELWRRIWCRFLFRLECSQSFFKTAMESLWDL